MRIDSSGNVGIGGTQGSSKLFVDNGAGTRLFLGLSNNIYADAYEHIWRSPSAAAERMRIDSSGNLLVGTTNVDPAGADVAGTAIGSTGYISMSRSSGAVGIFNRKTNDGNILEFNKDGTNVGSIGASSGDLVIGTGVSGVRFKDSGPSLEPRAANGNGNDGGIDLGMSGSRWRDLYLSNAVKFGSQDALATDGTSNYIKSGSAIYFQPANATRMLLDASGNLLVGTTSTSLPTTDAFVFLNNGEFRAGNDATSGGSNVELNRENSDGDCIRFYRASTEVGSISVTTSATAYNTSSDQRLKDNIVDAPSASDDIDAIQVRSFDWKADGSHQKYGMVAQELQSVAPEAVSGDADSDDMMGVDYSKLVPMLVKEIQSLRARVAQLEGAN